MGAVTFAATLLEDHCTGINERTATFSLALPTVWTAAGQAWDLSSTFDFVKTVTFGAGDAVTDHADKYGIFGTRSTAAGKGYGLYTASSIKLVAHRDPADATSTIQAFAATPDSTDLSGVQYLIATVVGC